MAQAESLTITGTGVVSGVAYAPVSRVQPRPQLPTHGTIEESEQQAEIDHFAEAVVAVQDNLLDRAEHATGNAAEVLRATAELTADRGLSRAVKKLIKQNESAEWAVVQAVDNLVTQFERLGGLYAERTTDLKDIRDRVIAELRGEPAPGVPEPTRPIVLVAEDLAPADTAGLNPELTVALVTEAGGKTSHTAIIARQLGIPCIVGTGKAIRQIKNDTPVLVDGKAGTVISNPDPDKAEAAVAESTAYLNRVRAWKGPGRTSDGYGVELLANVGNGEAAAKAAAGESEGVGLFRTELCFLSAPTEPSIEDQAAIYREVLEPYAGRGGHTHVVIRTLDAGSDKPLAFANFETEENPALGVRGLRLATDNPELLAHQLDAIAAAKAGLDIDVWVMAPMVATVAEARDFAKSCRDRGLWPGVMVEVPAVALNADQVLAEVEFFSIGTNDLTQYAMASDRLSPHLAALNDPWQPAVLRLIQMAAQAGLRANKPVGVCGEAAADPLLACVLAGLGVTSLSMAAPALPAVGVQLGDVTIEQCRQAAQAAVAAPDAVSAKAKAAAILGA
ncbi:phosphoenolpyruvate--protein phosphotransferase [Propionibacterium australiense]|uniref:Phosphoenolpyruvate-protein phosphotransferase n=1 Tax=Propionibacterium australiense TaxID=119981 RepID=A0A383S5K9_9ACTN|nr:phosphoenolpyruvate--protein phosphotransferase [Propionibacterium australiense]RLP09797.1 phosphoenolpyruvate--protein phosphotransferase [Propionibacterium australiense]RLP10154.1 phosphoenolpyruvate--protein phosphotransferase [Propionibacterium australiense]SYZ33275.1 phosphoenolpyruvate-protein phosphotransferase [Propionibacterium australiense]VEH89231.1 Phosphoenolpyruvate-protein phosphotransferase [Propionibacterium australiense]